VCVLSCIKKQSVECSNSILNVSCFWCLWTSLQSWYVVTHLLNFSQSENSTILELLCQWMTLKLIIDWISGHFSLMGMSLLLCPVFPVLLPPTIVRVNLSWTHSVLLLCCLCYSMTFKKLWVYHEEWGQTKSPNQNRKFYLLYLLLWVCVCVCVCGLVCVRACVHVFLLVFF
jgi:hypothetical protein